MKKRILSMVLILCFVIAMIPMGTLSANAAEDYRGWSQGDSRWGSLIMGNGTGASVAWYGCTSVSITKLMRQSGAVDSNYTPYNFVTSMNSINGYNSSGGVIWGSVSKLVSGFTYFQEVVSSNESIAIDYVNQGYFILVEGNTSEGYHFCAVDNALTKSNGYLTVMNTWSGNNINVKCSSLFSSIICTSYPGTG